MSFYFICILEVIYEMNLLWLQEIPVYTLFAIILWRVHAFSLPQNIWTNIIFHIIFKNCTLVLLYKMVMIFLALFIFLNIVNPKNSF